MPLERPVRFALSDIVAVVCECEKCGVRLSIPPARVRAERFAKCPACSSPWFDEEGSPGNMPVNPVLAVLAALRGASEQPQTPGVRVSFELASLTAHV